MAGSERERTITSPDGCRHAATCLECPLADCTFETGRDGVREVRLEARRLRAVELERQGLTAVETANRMGVSRRSANRYRREGSK